MAGDKPSGGLGGDHARSTSIPGASTDGRGAHRVTPSDAEVEAILQLLFPEQPKGVSNSLQIARQAVDETGRKLLKDSTVSQEDKEEQFGKQALSVGQEGKKECMKGSVDKLGPAVRGCFQTVLKDVREPLRVWRPVACKRKHALPMVYERVKTLILYDDNE